MSSVLEEILAWKRRELENQKAQRPLRTIERALKDRPPVRSFREAVHREGRLSLIAEVKRASPSAGAIRPDADPVKIARAYESAGAQAVSVLTDAKYFQGSLKDLERVRQKIGLPVLRKDFLLEEYQVVEAAAAGADAVLLIAAAVPAPLFKRLLRLAADLSVTVLAEVHAEAELDAVLEAGAEVIGINNRNLSTFEVDLKTSKRLMPRVPEGKTVVSESGLKQPEDVAFIRRLGAHAVLIGEELMGADDPAGRIRALLGG